MLKQAKTPVDIFESNKISRRRKNILEMFLPTSRDLHRRVFANDIANRKDRYQTEQKSVTGARTANGQIWSLLTVGEIVRGVVDNVIIANRVTGITTRYESVWYVCREVVTDWCLAWVMAEPFCNTLLGSSRHAILEAVRASLEVSRHGLNHV